MGKYAVENTPLGRTRQTNPGDLRDLGEGYNVRGGYPEGARGVPKFDDYNDPANQAKPRPAPGPAKSAPFKIGSK